LAFVVEVLVGEEGEGDGLGAWLNDEFDDVGV
jgi:hypothetical protein